MVFLKLLSEKMVPNWQQCFHDKAARIFLLVDLWEFLLQI